MYEIEKRMLDAIRQGRDWSESNTEVMVFPNNVIKVHLFGNCIAIKKNGSFEYHTCGWNTRTTVSRLKALGCNCKIKNSIIVDKETLKPIPL